MSTAIKDSMTDNSVKDDTGDVINGSEVDANPNAIADILDGTTATDLGGAGAVDFLAARIIDLGNAAGSVQTNLVIEWDPADGNQMTDNASGIGVAFKMPDDADNQDTFASINAMCVSDATTAEEGELALSVVKAGTLTETVTLSSAAFAPVTTDHVSLGTSALNFSDLFLDSGAVINFDGGNVTVTHASGALTNSGTLTNTGLVTATAGITSGSAIKSDTDSTDDLGTTSVRWANIYTDNIGDTGQDLTVLATTVNLPSGTVLDFNSANVTVTHSSSKLALVGGLDVGVDGTGHDVKLFGDTSGKYLLWDQSEDLAVLQGSLVVGHTALDGITSSEPHIQIHNTGNPAFGAFRWADSAYGPINYMGKSRNGTIGSHAIVEDGDILGEIKFLGDDGVDLNSVAASIGAAVDGTPGSNDMPGRLVFSTTADGAVAPTERMRIDTVGRVLIGHTASLPVYGTQSPLQIHGSSPLSLSRWVGSAGAPYLQFAKSRGTSPGSFTTVADGDELGNISFSAADNTDVETTAAVIQVKCTGTVGGNRIPGQFSIWVSDAANPSALQERFKIITNGDAYTNDGTIHSLSDISSKKDVADFTDGLAVLTRLQPIKYKFNGRYGMGPDDGVERLGFSAQAVQGVAPYLVSETTQNIGPPLPPEPEDGQVQETANVLGMSQTKLIPIMVNAFKEVEARLAALEAA